MREVDLRASLSSVSQEAHPARSDAFFSALFEAQFGFVWGSLRRLGIHERDVEDVAQDVFVNVYRHLDAYDPTRPVRPWLFAFAVHAASDYRRLARHRVESVGEPPEPPTHKGPLADEALARREEETLVCVALDAIPLERRAVLIAYELDEVPIKDVAESLSIPLFTAYSRLRIARDEFREAVKRLRQKQERR